MLLGAKSTGWYAEEPVHAITGPYQSHTHMICCFCAQDAGKAVTCFIESRLAYCVHLIIRSVDLAGHQLSVPRFVTPEQPNPIQESHQFRGEWTSGLLGAGAERPPRAPQQHQLPLMMAHHESGIPHAALSKLTALAWTRLGKYSNGGD